MSEDGKNRGVPAEHHHIQHQQYEGQYGTFQGVANYPPPPPVMGLPQPVPPPGATEPSAPPPPPPQYYAQGYQNAPGTSFSSFFGSGGLMNSWALVLVNWNGCYLGFDPWFPVKLCTYMHTEFKVKLDRETYWEHFSCVFWL
jgi:hypothetical protein